MLDMPVFPPQNAPAVVAQASQPDRGDAKFDRTIGICHPIENSSDARGMHGSSLSPVLGVKNYFYAVEGRKIEGSGKIRVQKPPAHGKLESFLERSGEENIEYLPTPGYLGPDHATLVVNIGRLEVKAMYFFYVEEVLDNFSDKRLCPRMYWKIALDSEPPTTSQAADPGNREVTERLIGRIGPTTETEWIRVSPDARRVAYAAGAGGKKYDATTGKGKLVAVIDGQEAGKPYDSLGGTSLGEIIFSPDGKRLAYVASNSGKWFVVVDGKEGKKYDGLVSALSFSPDSRHVVYTASADGKSFAVVDGKEGKHYDVLGVAPIFSPDSRRVAYAAQTGGKQFAVVDGKEGVHYEPFARIVASATEDGGDYYDIGGFLFSPDSKRVTHVVSTGPQSVVVVDGQDGEYHNGLVRSLVFSPNSKRMAYVAATEDKRNRFAVVDERQGKPYEGVRTPVFSPDSKRMAYAARAGGQWLMVVDGKEGKRYDNLGTPVFSPDGKRVAYAAQALGRWLMVEDGKESKDYRGTGMPVFSPNGKRMAFLAQAEGGLIGWLVVADGKEGAPYNSAGTPLFSPDSKRLAYWAQTGNKWFVVVDGQKGKPYDEILGNPIVISGQIVEGEFSRPLRFDSPENLHYIAMKDRRSVFLVEEALK